MAEEENFENFLKRWSRRKLETRQEPQSEPRAGTAATAADSSIAQPATGVPPAVATATAVAPPAAASGQQPELPSVDSLKGLASDYKEFLNPGVDENLRRSALKKLFDDPHFKVMDGLDVYIDDYSKPDPIPEAMLKTLAHAKHLLFPEECERQAQAEARERAAESPAQASALPPAESQASPDPGPVTEAAPRVPAEPSPEEAKR
jgi:hypothetical protein